MTVRLYEWDKTETGWAWIEITDNKVVNLKLRDENNLIKINEDDEAYVDLQLDDGIEPWDDLPVGVETGRVLVADGRPVNGTLILAKTTSWDEIQLLYWDDWKIYADNGTWTFKTLGWTTAYFKTQAEYDALPQSKESDNNLYIIVDHHNEACTINFKAAPSNYGTVSPSSITAHAWDLIIANGNVLTIWNQTITASQNDFGDWFLDGGGTFLPLPDRVERDMDITATYYRIV